MAAKNPTFAVASYGNIQSYIDQGLITYPSYVFCKDKNILVFVDSNLKIQEIKGFNQSSIVVVESLPTENIQSNTFYICNGKGYLLINDILVPVFKDLTEEKPVDDYDLLKNIPIVNKHGDVSSPIVLSDLEDGSYSISGQYKIGGNMSTVYVPSKSVMVLVDSDEEHKYITRLGAKYIYTYEVDLISMSVVMNKYVTQSWVLEQGYATEAYVNQAIEDLYNRIASETVDTITKVSQLENDAGYLTAENFKEITYKNIDDLF